MNEEQREKLLQAIRTGTDLDTSCHFAGLSVASVYRDLERGKAAAEVDQSGHKVDDSDVPYWELWKDLTLARADSIVRNVASVQQAARNGSWQAAAWWLERAVPESYSKTSSERSRKPIDNPRGEISGA